MKMNVRTKATLLVLLAIVGVGYALFNITETTHADDNIQDIVVVKQIKNEEDIAERALLENSKKVKVSESKSVEHFDWNNFSNQSLGKIGKILCEDKKINTILTFGGEQDNNLLAACGIHRELSDKNHLTILGHNCEQYGKKLENKLFTNLKKLEIGDKVILDTIFGQYQLVVEGSFYVSPADYEKNNYEVLLQGDVTFATCEWRKPMEKGRRIIVLSVDSME